MPATRRVYRFLGICLLPVLLSSCANQIPPSGGPMDEQGPRVVYVFPEPFSLNVNTETIEIEFDEYVDKRSAMESIFISPPIDELEFDWHGKTVEISFTSALRPNTTYLVTVGTDVTDLEPSRKNRMEHAFSFPFSTGSAIDRGLIAGKILPLKPGDELGGVMVNAYELSTGRMDTLNVTVASPTYVTQAGKDGSFTFAHIRLSSYFLLSVRDAARNTVYDVEEDEFAVPASLVRLSRLDTASTSVVLQLAREDTTAPRLTEISPLDVNHLHIEFSEPIDTSRQRRPQAEIIDTISGMRSAVYAVTPILPDLKKAVLTTDFLDTTRVYNLTLTGVYDAAGNSGKEDALVRTFRPSSKRDTLRPGLKNVSVRDSAKNISVMEEVYFTFSEPLGGEVWSQDRIRLWTGSDGLPHPVDMRWVTESILGIRPSTEMRSESWYTLKVVLHGLQDWKREELRDSIRIISFQTEDVYDSGIIEGTVAATASIDTAGPVFVVARSIEEKGAPLRVSRAGGNGAFTLSRLRPGRYTLHAFKDRNGDGSFDAGLPYPYRPAERRSVWTDTLKVRSRWPLDGVMIRIP